MDLQILVSSAKHLNVECNTQLANSLMNIKNSMGPKTVPWGTPLIIRRFTRMIDGVGLLPYSERLETLKLTTLIERRARGDLIEVFKAKKEFSSINGVFKFSRSGMNLISTFNNYDGSAKFRKLKRNFINERVVSFWNKLPTDIKMAQSIDSFKFMLEGYKLGHSNGNVIDTGNFWELSNEVLDRIEGNNYIENKKVHNEHLKLNPFVAKKKFINLY